MYKERYGMHQTRGTSGKKVVDTTGAGDYYAAGFLYGLTCGYSLEKCSIIGSILASNVIQVVGTTLSKKKMGRNKVKYRGPSTGLNRIMY